MSDSATERLYQLLPAFHRQRDAMEGEPLRALLAVIEAEFGALEADIAGLYENWFIETCDEWVVPYIGDLLRVRGLRQMLSAGFSQRAFVANTLAYRRRKGTAAVLEQLARDITGWPPRAVEFFERLSATQHMNHVRAQCVRTPDLRDTNSLELLPGPFGTAEHTVDVRRIARNRGLYNIPNVGLFLWRLESYGVVRSDAFAVADPPDGRFTFDPLGRDLPVFNPPQTETEITHLAEEVNVPGALRRRPLYDELESRRLALVNDETPSALYFGEQPVLQVFLDGQSDPVPPERISICDLGNLPQNPNEWRRPAAEKKYRKEGPPAADVPVKILVGVDPVRGRVALPAGSASKTVEVSYSYAAPADIGGGPYNRQGTITPLLNGRKVGWQAGVSRTLPNETGTLFQSLTNAVRKWNQQPAGTVGILAILDSHSYRENLAGADAIQIPPGSLLIIVAADWPAVESLESPGVFVRPPGEDALALEGVRPHVHGTLEVHGVPAVPPGNPGELMLNGLLVEGQVKVLDGDLGGLQIVHSTLVLERGGLSVGAQNLELKISVERSICGPLVLSQQTPGLRILDSILSGSATHPAALDAAGTDARIERSTFFGGGQVRSLEASESIFTGGITVERRQEGCVRFSYVPLGSRTPRQYRCQPGFALKDITGDELRARIAARLRPTFTSVKYSDPGYAQLGAGCAEEIRTGAEEGLEMGVFQHLRQPLRESILRANLDEYLRLGLEAGIFYVT